jgi:hypothetical protein
MDRALKVQQLEWTLSVTFHDWQQDLVPEFAIVSF